jgi:hypothetical protein
MAIPFVGEDILLQSRVDRRDSQDKGVAKGLSQDDAWLQATGSYYLEFVARINEPQHATEMTAVRLPTSEWPICEHELSVRSAENHFHSPGRFGSR